MGSNPLNLAFRFLLELSALISSGLWAWNLTETNWRYLLVILFPLIMASVWGIFNVPGDPSRSGNAPIVISGKLRLSLEFFIFGVACLFLYRLSYSDLWWIMAAAVILHYMLSYDRIGWLFAH